MNKCKDDDFQFCFSHYNLNRISFDNKKNGSIENEIIEVSLGWNQQ